MEYLLLIVLSGMDANHTLTMERFATKEECHFVAEKIKSSPATRQVIYSSSVSEFDASCIKVKKL